MIYKSRSTRAKPEWQGFMNCMETESRFITSLWPASFAYFLGTLLRTISTISPLIHFSMHIPDYIRYIAVSNGRVAPVMGYNTSIQSNVLMVPNTTLKNANMSINYYHELKIFS